MFTGIVTHLGRVESLEKRSRGARVTIAPADGVRYRAGESVCVSGVCLTAAPGDRVNLERALRWGDRLSGHFVMGHVDGISRIVSVRRAGNSWEYRFSIPRGLGRLVAEKGSVALDGVSLTVASRRGRNFSVSVIPETFRRTTLGARRSGDAVNFEADVFARYSRASVLRRIRVAAPTRR
jgi:riboflavin synthase